MTQRVVDSQDKMPTKNFQISTDIQALFPFLAVHKTLEFQYAAITPFWSCMSLNP